MRAGFGQNSAQYILKKSRAVCRQSVGDCSGRLRVLGHMLEDGLINKSHLLDQGALASGDSSVDWDELGWAVYSPAAYASVDPGASTSREIISKDTDLPEKVEPIKISQFFDEQFQYDFNHPELTNDLVEPSESSSPPSSFFNVSAQNWRSILRRARRNNVIDVRSSFKVDPRLSAGAFAVDKRATACD